MTTCEFGKVNTQRFSARCMIAYNRISREIHLKQSDYVLVLLRKTNNWLLMQWKCPYVITSKVGPLDYQVDTEGKHQTLKLHVEGS